MEQASRSGKNGKIPGKQKINPTSVLITILIVSLIILFSITIPEITPREKKDLVSYECTYCGYITRDKFGSPKVCPKCGKKAMYPVSTFSCRDCDATFEGYKTIVFYDKNGNIAHWELMRPDGIIVNALDPKVDFRNKLRCPYCGSANIESADIFSDLE